jgi:hypothetical protein
MNIYAKAGTNNDENKIGLRYFLIGYNSDTTSSVNLVANGSDLGYLYDSTTSQKIDLDLIIDNPINISSYNFLVFAITSRNLNATQHQASVYFQSSNTYSHIHTTFGIIGATGPQGATGATGPSGVITNGTNTLMGVNVLTNTVGATGNNTAAGQNVLANNTTGYNNVGLGNDVLTATVDGYDNIAIGHNAGATGADYFNSISIGANAKAGTNSIRLGDERINSFSCHSALTVTSDATLKTKFQDLDVGMQFVEKLRPLYYEWINNGQKDIGFTAQDLLEIQENLKITIPNLVNTNHDNKYGVTYEKLIPIIAKSIQELNNEIKELKNELDSISFIQTLIKEVKDIKKENEDIKERLSKLENRQV